MLARFSIRSRVFLLCGAVVACLGVGGLFWLDQVQDGMIRQASSSLSRHLPLIRELLKAREAQWNSPGSMDSLADWLGSCLQVRITFILPDGTVVGDSQVELAHIPLLENHAHRIEVREALLGGLGSSIRYSNTLGADFLYLAALFGNPERPGMVIRLSVPLEEVSWIARKGYAAILAGTILGWILSFLAAHLVARVTGKELGDLARKARQMAQESGREEGSSFQVSEVGGVERALVALREQMDAKIKDLEKARYSMDTLIQGMVEGILLTDKNGRILLVNKALSGLMEPRVDPLGRTAAEAYRQAGLQEAIEKCIQDGRTQSLELRTSGASPKALEVQVGPVGQTGAVAVFHDITERKRMEEMRRDLVASVSHELRTPVAAVRASAETLLEGALEEPEQARRFAQMIHRHALRLQRILEELLDLSRLESGILSPRRSAVKLGVLAEVALEAVGELACAKGVELSKDVPEPEAMVQGDQRELEKALVNLLHNGVSYTESGGRVSLRVRVEGQEVYIFVEDTGIGIPAEHIPRIFERFYRVDKDRSRAMGGTGLGLSIVKHVVQNHGGKVDVESTPGKGSVFRISLPLMSPLKENQFSKIC